MEDLRLHGLISGGGSNIKSIQRGTATMETGLTEKLIDISTIDMNSAIVMVSGCAYNESYADRAFVAAEIASNAQIKLIRGYSSTNNNPISWQVVEFNNVKSLQRGSILLPFNSPYPPTVDVTVNTINPEKSMLCVSFHTVYSDNSGLAIRNIQGAYNIKNSTTIEFIHSSTKVTAHWELVEFK